MAKRRASAPATTTDTSSTAASDEAVVRAYHHGDLRRALLEAGQRELEAVGPDELSLRGVARRAGVSHAAPYHHFKDKGVLLAHLAKEAFLLFHDHLVAAANEGGDVPRARLARMGLGYLRFARKHPALFALLGSPQSQSHADVWAEASARAYGVLVDEVARVRRDAGRTGSPEYDAYLHWAMVHGLAHLETGFGLCDRADVDALYRHIAARVDSIYEPGAHEPEGGPPLGRPTARQEPNLQ